MSGLTVALLRSKTEKGCGTPTPFFTLNTLPQFFTLCFRFFSYFSVIYPISKAISPMILFRR